MYFIFVDPALMIVRQLIDERADYRSDVIGALEAAPAGRRSWPGPAHLAYIPVTRTLAQVEGKNSRISKPLGALLAARRRWQLTVIRTLNPGGSVFMKANLAQ